jgi:hypothetical protein
MAAANIEAQQTTAASETKQFEILAVDGNTLVVRLPEGTREMTVPEDFRFTVNGQQLSVRELKAGMRGTATVTTRTTVTPVTVTEVKNGTVFERSGGSIIVQTDQGFKMFSQGDIDKRGIKIMKSGKPVNLDELRKGDRLTATIVTSMPPKVLTQKEVQAIVPTADTAAAPGSGSASAGARATTPAAPAPGSTAAGTSSAAKPAAKTLPKTASSLPLLAVSSAMLLALGLSLTLRRRLS